MKDGILQQQRQKNSEKIIQNGSQLVSLVDVMRMKRKSLTKWDSKLLFRPLWTGQEEKKKELIP